MAVCGDPAGLAAFQHAVYNPLGAVILATPFIAVMHCGNDKPAAVMAAAAGDVVKLVVAQLARLRVVLRLSEISYMTQRTTKIKAERWFLYFAVNESIIL